MTAQSQEMMKALVIRSHHESPIVEQVPKPQPTPGSAIVQVLAADVVKYTRDVYNGKRNLPFPLPLIGGSSAIARVDAVGPDSTTFTPGVLVFVSPIIRSRDGPSDVFLAGFHQGGTDGSKKLMHDVWRDWTYAEYCRVPLENLTLLEEQRLANATSNGSQLWRLCHVARLLVPYGGLRDIELRPGQTLVDTPATGPFGAAAVAVGLAMGAKVIAMGRNKDVLAKMEAISRTPTRLATVPITGDALADAAALKAAAGGEVDAFFDIRPPEAAQGTHPKSGILSLRHGGRVSLMGGYQGDISIPHSVIVHKNLRLYGKWMCDRRDIPEVFKMIEIGLLSLDACELAGTFALEDFGQAWDTAAEKAAPGQVTVITPFM